jgi:hypothetical protein
LQELVYKQGQAGVTKATVSIVFDNSDRARSPIGYEECGEITVTRQVRLICFRLILISTTVTNSVIHICFFLPTTDFYLANSFIFLCHVAAMFYVFDKFTSTQLKRPNLSAIERDSHQFNFLLAIVQTLYIDFFFGRLF